VFRNSAQCFKQSQGPKPLALCFCRVRCWAGAASQSHEDWLTTHRFQAYPVRRFREGRLGLSANLFSAQTVHFVRNNARALKPD
jgi:hypothetical protein